MKKYKEYMDNVRASDTLHQRLLGLETSGTRPVAWKKYGAMAAALALVVGLGGIGYAHYYNTVVNPTGQAFLDRTMDFDPELAPAVQPDIALASPGDVTESGEKTIGGYEVVSGSGENAMVTYYVLPYIDYGRTDGAKGASASLDWDIPQGAHKRDLSRDEIVALMGGEDAVNTHLGWGMYALTGWAAWYEDGSFWGAYINGLLPNYDGPTSQFEFAVTAGELPPTCIGYPSSVTQEIRGLTVTADGYDLVATPIGGVDESSRRVSFMKDNYGYRFDITGTGRALTEERVSRLVARIADKGLALTYTCDLCGNTFPFGTLHNDPDICGLPLYDSGEDDPYVCTGYPVPDPGDGGTPDMSAPPRLNVVCGDESLTGRSGNYHWNYPGEDGQTVGTIACGLHPLDFREAPSLTTADRTVALNFFDLPDRVSVVCWPDSEWGNTSAASQPAQASWNEQTQGYELTLKEGGWIYAVTAGWDDQGTADYVFYLIKS